MSISSILSNGIAGIQNGFSRTGAASSRIANQSVEDQDVAKNLIDLRVGEHEVKAAANVIKADDEMLGTLIDIRS